jgi:hypothetical protein
MIVSVPRPNWDPTPPPLPQASVVLPGPKRGDPLAYTVTKIIDAIALFHFGPWMYALVRQNYFFHQLARI